MPRKLFGLGSGTPSRFPYQDRPQSGPGIGASSGQVIRATLVIVSGFQGVFVYNGHPGPGTLIGSVSDATTDPFGNPVVPTIAAYDVGPGRWTSLTGAGLSMGTHDPATTTTVPASLAHNDANTPSGQAITVLESAFTGALSAVVETMKSASADGTKLTSWQVVIGSLVALTADEATGLLTIPIALSVTGATSGAGQLAFVKQTGTDNALTVFLNVGSGGGSAQAALNVISDNPNFSAAEVRGTETGRGTLKITHDGYADGSDANAAGLSIDMQTTQGGGTGTNARGIFITSTTDSPMGGDAIAVFVGVPVPSLKFQVNGAGNLVARANAFFANPVIIGSTSSDAGGSGSGLTLCHTTDPASNPAAGHVILFVDAAGNLKARGSAGTITTIATP
jgi:hypothetical protein